MVGRQGERRPHRPGQDPRPRPPRQALLGARAAHRGSQPAGPPGGRPGRLLRDLASRWRRRTPRRCSPRSRTLEEGQAFYKRAQDGHCGCRAATRTTSRSCRASCRSSAAPRRRRWRRSVELDLLLVHEHALAAARPMTSASRPTRSTSTRRCPRTSGRRATSRGTRTRYELTVAFARRDNLTVRQVLSRARRWPRAPHPRRDRRAGRGLDRGVVHQRCRRRLQRDAGCACPRGSRRSSTRWCRSSRSAGLFRRDYEGSTLRDHYGLPVPARSAAALAHTG